MCVCDHHCSCSCSCCSSALMGSSLLLADTLRSRRRWYVPGERVRYSTAFAKMISTRSSNYRALLFTSMCIPVGFRCFTESPTCAVLILPRSRLRGSRGNSKIRCAALVLRPVFLTRTPPAVNDNWGTTTRRSGCSEIHRVAP